MGFWMKILSMMLKLQLVWANLIDVKANDPSTTSASYMPAAAVVLDSGSVKDWLAKRTPAERQAATEALPLVLWMIDEFTEPKA